MRMEVGVLRRINVCAQPDLLEVAATKTLTNVCWVLGSINVDRIHCVSISQDGKKYFD